MQQPIYSTEAGCTVRKRCNTATANRNRHLESLGLGPPRRRDILLKRPLSRPFALGAPSVLRPPLCLSPSFLGLRRPVFKADPKLACPPVSSDSRWGGCSAVCRQISSLFQNNAKSNLFPTEDGN